MKIKQGNRVKVIDEKKHVLGDAYNQLGVPIYATVSSILDNKECWLLMDDGGLQVLPIDYLVKCDDYGDRLELLKSVKQGDVIEYVRQDGEIDMESLYGDVTFDERKTKVIHNGHTTVLESKNHPTVNKAIYLYKRQPNGDLKRYTIYSEEEE